MKKKIKEQQKGWNLIWKLLSWGAIFVCVLQYFKEIKSTHFENDKRIHRKGWEGKRAFSWVCFFIHLKHIGKKYCSYKAILSSDLWLGLEALDDSFKGTAKKKNICSQHLPRNYSEGQKPSVYPYNLVQGDVNCWELWEKLGSLLLKKVNGLV